jgi:hypothetical protein
MSQVKISGNASGTGVLTIAAPNTNTDRSITIPDKAGAIAVGAGTIVQVVQSTYSTTTSNSTGTQADTGLSATITPTSSSNKILIFANQNGLSKSSNQGLDLRLYRGTTVILNSILQNAGYDTTSNRLDFGSATGVYLDSPATTSATTYKTQFSRFSGTGSVTVQQGTSISTMTLMEVVA